MKSLVGSAVVFAPDSIRGPRAVACRAVPYRISEYTADMLFQGAFAEMHERNPSADPARIYILKKQP